MEVQIIKARQSLCSTKANQDDGKRLRVCAYCRVSTDSEEQESSYNAQITHYTNYISANPDWVLAGIFADEGLSGTSVRRREEFNRMIAACEEGKIDMIITKSISRFARNTLDCLNYIRRLKALNIPILFEKEAINTKEAVGEVLITILASIAQQESKSISDNVRMGIEYGFQEGRGILNYSCFLGYTGNGTPGELVIVPEEAELIRRIFREYLEGFSPYRIASRLEAEGAVTARGGNRWYNSTIVNILQNEKYCGELLMQKYYTEDYLTHRLVKNTGQRPQYFVANHHDPIIPKEVFYQVQAERIRRASLKQDPSRLRFGNRLALNGRLVCGKCGSTFRRFLKPDVGKTEWRCRRRAYVPNPEDPVQPNWRCDSRILRETEVETAVLNAFNRLPLHHRRLLSMKRAILLQINGLDMRLRAIAVRQKALEAQQEKPAVSHYQDNGSDKPAYRVDGIQETLARLKRRKEILCSRRADCAQLEMQIRMLLELTEQMTMPVPSDVSVPWGPACSSYEEFFCRTRYRVPEGLLDPAGKLKYFDNDIITRYLERIIVAKQGYKIVFKAGIRIICNI